MTMGKDVLKVIRIPISTPTLLPHTTTNCYLIGTENESILVDAGYDRHHTKIDLEKAIKENKLALPKKILLTHYHPDHAPGVLQLQDWKAEIYCHPLEKEGTLEAIFPLKELFFLQDGDRIVIDDIEIVILHAPGHTAGHLSLYIPSLKMLISGDNIVAEGTSWIGPPDGDMADYLQTLNRFKQFELDKIGPGHGDWIINPYEHIDFVINRRLMREVQIRTLLEEHQPLTSAALTNLIYQNSIHSSVFEVARRTTEAHLHKLIKEGYVLQQASLYSLIS